MKKLQALINHGLTLVNNKCENLKMAQCENETY